MAQHSAGGSFGVGAGGNVIDDGLTALGSIEETLAQEGFATNEVADTLVAINEAFDTFFSITADLNKQAIALFSEFELGVGTPLPASAPATGLGESC